MVRNGPVSAPLLARHHLKPTSPVFLLRPPGRSRQVSQRLLTSARPAHPKVPRTPRRRLPGGSGVTVVSPLSCWPAGAGSALFSSQYLGSLSLFVIILKI